MTLSAIEGQAAATSLLKSALAARSVHHAYLFTGPEGVGKARAAIALTQAILCPTEPGEGCGKCSICQRTERGNHPDVFWLYAESERVERGVATRADFANAPSREIRVDQIRQLQERLSVRPLEGNAKVAIVPSAHRMNAQAQNALLKTLEEPPPGTHLVLVTSCPQELLPTLRSRCAPVAFAPLRKELLASALDAESISDKRALFARFETLGPKDLRPAMRLAETLGASRDTAESALALLTLWIRDVRVAQTKSEDWLNPDLVETIQTAARRWAADALHRALQLMVETQEALASNGSPRLQLERLFLLISMELRAEP